MSATGDGHVGWLGFMGVWGFVELWLLFDLLACERRARKDGVSHRRGGHLLAIAIVAAVLLVACLVRVLAWGPAR